MPRLSGRWSFVRRGGVRREGVLVAWGGWVSGGVEWGGGGAYEEEAGG